MTSPYQRHSRTSRAAAERIEPQTGTLRRWALDAIRKAGDAGLTDEELGERIRLDPSTARPRRIELVTAGFVVDSGARRRTRAGREATVWRAVARCMECRALGAGAHVPGCSVPEDEDSE